MVTSSGSDRSDRSPVSRRSSRPADRRSRSRSSSRASRAAPNSSPRRANTSPAAPRRTGRSPQPQAVWMSHGAGSKVYDVDGTEYVDMHGGYGASIAGHAHPAIVAAVSEQVRRGTHFAQPTEDAIWIAGELARRFGLPLWRFANSGTEATMDAVHLVRALTGPRPHHQGRGLLPRPPRLGAGVGAARRRRDRPARAPHRRRRQHRHPGGDPRSRGRGAVQRPRRRARARWPSTAARSPAMILEPMMMNAGIIPPDDGLSGRDPRPACTRHGALLDLRRGQDRLHHRARRRHRAVRRRARHGLPGQGARAAGSRSRRSAARRR